MAYLHLRPQTREKFMTAIHETAYPHLRSDWITQQLVERFTPTEEELAFAKRCTRQVVS